MKKYLIPLLFLPLGNLHSQCVPSIPTPPCGAFNTLGASPSATFHWFEQSFSVPNSGYLQYLKTYVVVLGNTPSTMKFSILSQSMETLFSDTLPLPAAQGYFLYCDTTNWSVVYPENLFLNENESYSFRVERLDTVSNPWITYAVNSNLFLEGLCTNDLNEVEGLPDPSDPGTDDQMLPEEDCAFVLRMQCPCLGDYNFDGQRSVADLVIFISAFGEFSEAVDITDDDLNLVSIDDLMVFIGVYGVPCP